MSNSSPQAATEDRFCDEVAKRPARNTARRLAIWAAALSLVTWLVYLMATAKTGPLDPTDAANRGMSNTTVIFNSSMIVFREGLEAVLILAAVTASFRGANMKMRRPVLGGALIAFAAACLTWFGAGQLLNQFAGLGLRLEAITGALAIIVLLVVLNWFVHKVYWSEWISKHNKRRREVMAAGKGVIWGLIFLGFTSVYREGFETVLFLQNLRITNGASVVREGVFIGLALTLAVGVCVFGMQQKLPYKKMLIGTGILIGFVLVVMVGGTASTFQDLGWLPRHPIGTDVIPAWMGSWFEFRPTVETIAAQILAAGFVIGSYYAAEYVKVRKPRKNGLPVAVAAVEPAAQPPQTLTTA